MDQTEYEALYSIRGIMVESSKNMNKSMKPIKPKTKETKTEKPKTMLSVTTAISYTDYHFTRRKQCEKPTKKVRFGEQLRAL